MKIKTNTSLSLRKLILSALVAAPLATLPAPLWALPVNPSGTPASTNVTSNSASTTFTQAGTSLLITDTVTNRLVLKWNEFGSGTSPINAGETVSWTLPTAASAVLNMVSTGATVVNGALQSNGSIFILNANGITLGSTSTVNAAGLGLSTVPQNEFFFLANGTLDNSGVTATTIVGDVVVNVGSAAASPPTVGISVGTTGSVVLAGRSVDVSGVIQAGTLSVTSNNNTGTTGVRLAQSQSLIVGTTGTAATLTDPATSGSGNASIVTNGGAAALSTGANTTTIFGGTLTVDTSSATANGNVTQGGVINIGDTQSTGKLTVKAGPGTTLVPAGTVSLTNLTSNDAGQILDVTITGAGATSLKTNRDINLKESTIAGNLTVQSTNGNIRSGGEVTVTGGTISLTANANNKSITFKGPGDLTFAALSASGSTGNGVTLTSTTGSIILPSILAGALSGNLTVTAQNNITQAGPIVNTRAGGDGSQSRTARFEAVTGSIVLTDVNNDFTRVVLRGAPGGAQVVDKNDVTIGNGTNMTGDATITSSGGAITLGAAAGDTVTFNGNVTLNAPTSAINSAIITSGGSGYTSAPTVNDGATPRGTTTLGVTAISTPTTTGTGYTSVPSVTITNAAGDIGTDAAAASVVTVNSIAVSNAGSGYTALPTIAVTPAPTGGVTAAVTPVLKVAAVAVTNAGTGYTAVPTVTVAAPGTVGGTLAVVTPVLAVATGVLATPGAGYTSTPTVTFAAPPAGGTIATATATVTGGVVTAITITNAGSGYTSLPTVTIAGGGATTDATATITGLNIQSVSLTTPGSGYTVLPTVTISGGGGTSGAAAITSLNINSFTVTNGGVGYTSRPSITVIGGGGTNGSGSTNLYVTGINVTNSGTGYTAMPTLALAAPPAGSGITVPTATGSVQTTTITSSGTSVTAAPALTFVGGGGAGATGVFALGTGGGVNDKSDNVKVVGLTTINSIGPVVLDGATSSGIGLNHSFGQINVNQAGSTGGVTLYEATTLNLGAINSAGDLRAYSSAGDVIDTGPITVRNAVFGAGTAAAPGNITIDAVGNAITGRISLLDDVALLTNAAPGDATLDVPQVVGTYLANNVSITTGTNITLGPIATTAGTGLLGTLSVSGGSITFAGQTNVAGAVTVVAAGDLTANNNDNQIATANITAGGNVDFRGGSTFLVNAALTQSVVDRTAYFRSSGALRIGTFNSNYTGLVKFEARGSNTIQDTVNGIRVYGPVEFASQSGITINRLGHSFGRVTASTTDRNGSITIVESGGLRLGSISTSGTGSFTATSTTGDILQDTTQNGIRLGNSLTGTATFNAPLGNITLDDNFYPIVLGVDPAPKTVNTMPRINATAGGNILINNPRTNAVGPTNLGNITAGGTLTVSSATADGLLSGDILQVANAKLNVYGTVTLNATGTNTPTAEVNIGNTGNRLGGIIASTVTGNITLTENTTLNLKSLQTAGPVTITSESGNIIDTSDATVAVNSVGTALVPINGTFNAPKGNVALGLATSNYGAVGFSTSGNVSILDSVGNLTLAASNIGGTLDVVSTVAGALLNQNAGLTVAGNVTLTTSSGGIDLSNGANQFGAIRFTAGAPGVLISENTTLNLRGGSTSTGPVQLVTNGNFVTSGAGASSITNNLTIQAQGTIIPGAGSLLVTGTFTVFSPSLKDLGALSKSGNLLNRDPVNLGSGPYVPPSL